MKRIRTSALLALLIIGSPSCKPKVSVPGGSVEQDGEQIKIQTGEGSVVAGGDISLPDGFPDDVPVPSGKILTAMKQPQGMMVSFQNQQTPQAALSDLSKKFQANGWEETARMEHGMGGSLTFEKKAENRSAQCAVAAADAGTAVTLILSNR